MSLLYSQVKSQIMIPQANIPNQRSEFHIKGDNRTFYSSMRLLNIGLHGLAGKNYNRLGGVHSLIDRIILYNGSEILSQSDNHKTQASHKMITSSNQYNFSEKRTSEHTNASFDLELVNNANLVKVDLQSYGLLNMPETTAAENQTAAGVIRLDEYLPLLGSLEVLNTDIFDNLRLVILWNRDYDEVFTNNTGDQSTIVSNTPLLVCDEIFDSKLKSKMMSSVKTVQWYEVEIDRVEMPVDATITANDTIQKLNTRVNGFNKKYIRDVWIQNRTLDVNDSLTGNELTAFGQLSSRFSDGASYNLRINGSSLYPRSGLNRPSYRMRHHCIKYPMMSAYPQCNTGAAVSSNLTSSVRLRAGRLDYCSMILNKRIEDLQFLFERVHSTDNDSVFNRRLQFLLFGSVLKTMMIKNGKYIIQYA